MGIYNSFSTFCRRLRMSNEVVSTIARRAARITARVNYDFRGIDSDSRYSLYVGSYGRGTDIHVSDIDMIVELHYKEYERYNSYLWNGQSALIQALKDSLSRT